MSIIKSKLGGRLLQPMLDQDTGIISYKLINEYKRIQHNFYFTSVSMTQDDRFLVYISTAETDKKQNLWIADFEKEEVRPLTTKGFDVESVILDEPRGKLFYTRDGICYGINIEDKVVDREEVLFEFPRELTVNGPVEYFSNHLTLNRKGDRMAFCGKARPYWYVGYYDLVEKKCHMIHKSFIKSTHVQMAPDDSNRILFCHDWWMSDKKDMKYDWDHRLWMYYSDTGETYQIFLQEHQSMVEHVPFHEFWKKDGSCIYFCDMPHGVVKHVPESPEDSEVVWKGPHCHAHCNTDGTLFVSDINPYGWPKGEAAKVAYYNKNTGKEGYIAFSLPPALRFANAGKRHYHPHPHPTFSPSDNWILYANTKNSELNLCLVDADDVF